MSMILSLILIFFLASKHWFSSAKSSYESPQILFPRSTIKFPGPFGLDNAKCEQSFYNLLVNSTNTKFINIDQNPQNQSYITSLIIQYSTSQTNFTEKYTDGTFQFTGTFNISGTLCTPIRGAQLNGAIQILVHGIGFDSSYWDFSVSISSLLIFLKLIALS